MAEEKLTDSILLSTKKICGLDPEYTVFDNDFIMYINSTIMILNQIGVGEKGYAITGNSETWEDFLSGQLEDIQSVITYMGLKVQMIFDPPASGIIKATKEEIIKELEWRIREEACF